MKICAVSGMLAALFIMRYARKMKFLLQCDSRHVPGIMKKDPFLIIILKGHFPVIM